MHRQNTQKLFRPSRSCERTDQLNSRASALARPSNLSVTYQHKPALLHRHHCSLLSPISASVKFPRTDSYSPGSGMKSQLFAGLRSPKTTLEKGLELVKRLYGPVPPLPEKQKEKVKQVMLLRSATTKDTIVVPAIPAPTTTFLDLQCFEKDSKVAKRRGSLMSLTDIPSVIKLKLIPASPRGSPKRKRIYSEVLSSLSPKARPEPPSLFVLTNDAMA